MPSVDVVDLSRLQFAATALYHFLFVPLTLGLSWILVICESVYVMTGREIYRDMTRFWGLLFGINFVMGVTTGQETFTDLNGNNTFDPVGIWEPHAVPGSRRVLLVVSALQAQQAVRHPSQDPAIATIAEQVAARKEGMEEVEAVPRSLRPGFSDVSSSL